MKSILVMGGAGYIGSHTVRHLLDAETVVQNRFKYQGIGK